MAYEPAAKTSPLAELRIESWCSGVYVESAWVRSPDIADRSGGADTEHGHQGNWVATVGGLVEDAIDTQFAGGDAEVTEWPGDVVATARQRGRRSYPGNQQVRIRAGRPPQLTVDQPVAEHLSGELVQPERVAGVRTGDGCSSCRTVEMVESEADDLFDRQRVDRDERQIIRSSGLLS